jgi:Zn-dependent membrane protease YugP
MAVAAHEVGHAQLHAEGTIAMQARSFLVPALTFSPAISYLCIFFGLIFNLAGLFYVGIVFFALMVVFTILTCRSRSMPAVGRSACSREPKQSPPPRRSRVFAVCSRPRR